MMYSHNNKKQKTKELDRQSQLMDVSEQNEIESAILRRNKPPKIFIPPQRSEKYKSDGGTPALLEKLTFYPKACVIESKGETKQGVQAKVDIARITTPSQSEIDIFRKKQKKGERSNEFTITDSIKKNSDYQKIKSYLSIPFYEEKRSSGNVTFSRLKKNGDLDNYRDYIKKNSSVAQTYLFHQTTNLVKTLDFLHNQTFIDEQGNMHRGIIHGDIKPDNLLVDKNGDLSLSDFGCARYADQPIEQLGMVSYLSPELLKVPGGIPSNPDKSDIWSLGVTLQSLVTGEYPIAPPPQSTSMGSMYIETKKDISGYSKIQVSSAPASQADHGADFFSDTPQGHQVRKNLAEQYLQSTACENNLKSKQFIDDLSEKPYQHDIDSSEVFRHLTSSMLSPVEARPTAKQLSTAMEKLVHYFPWDQKNNSEFVKKMTENNHSMVKDADPNWFRTEEKKQLEPSLPKLSAVRQPHKEFLDSALGVTSTTSSFFYPSFAYGTQQKQISAALLHDEEKKQPQPSLPKLSAVRQPHKELLDNAIGVTSTPSNFFSSSFTQRTQKEESEKIEYRTKINPKLYR